MYLVFLFGNDVVLLIVEACDCCEGEWQRDNG